MKTMRLLIACLLLIAAPVVSAQNVNTSKKTEIDRNKEAYEEIFHKEVGLEIFTTPNYQHLLDLIPAYLPHWTFKGIENTRDTIWAVGISNPEMDEQEGLSQAQLRAKALIALALKSRLQYISDDFSKLAEQGRLRDLSAKFQDFTRLQAEFYQSPGQYTVAKSIRNKYGETIALVGYNKNQDTTQTKTLNVTMERLNVYIETIEGIEKIATSRMFIEETGLTDTLSDELITERFNNGLTRTSSWQDSLLPPFERKAHYLTDSTSKDTLPAFTTDAVYGLWQGLLENMAYQISNTATQLPAVIKNTSDTYTTQNDYLIRTISSSNVRFTLKKWWLKNNDIGVEAKTEPLESLLPLKPENAN